MYRFIQRHGKKILAVFSAMLMISFMLPSAYQYAGGGRNPVYGTIGDGEKIRGQEVFNAHQAWELLSRVSDPTDPQRRPVTLALGESAVEQISRNPVLFLLLQKEAERMGVTVSQDQLNSLVQNTPWLMTTDPDRNDATQRAIGQLLLVRGAFVRAASAIKVTEPMLRHQLAEMGQSITLDAVEFNVAPYKDKVQPPTAEQLKEQFTKYADVQRGAVSAENPFGFGYRYPDRIKLQYIAVPRADVRKSVEGSKDAYQWEVDAQKHYIQNQSLFPTTQKAAESKSFDLGAPAPATLPTTRPFAEVRDDIRRQLIDRATDEKVKQVQGFITSTLAGDWVTYDNAAGGATKPSTAPASSLGVPYDSVDYLNRLAQQVQSKFGVLPTVQSVADRWLGAADIDKLPGIGQAVVTGTAEPVQTGGYLITFAAAFLTGDAKNVPDALKVMEPARPLSDATDTTYIARISDAQKSHKPETLAEVEADVRNDVITKQAYELAKGDAQKLLEQARQGDLKIAAGNRAVRVGPIAQRSGQPILGLQLTGDVANQFLGEAFRLVTGDRAGATTQPATGAAPAPAPSTSPIASVATRPTTGAATTGATAAAAGSKPARLIELARDGRVFVAQLADVQASWTDRSRPLMEAELARMLRGQFAASFGREWFDYDSVASRLNYVPDKNVAENPAPAAPRPPAPPIF